MKKETAKPTEAQLLDLLKKVLPKATHDPSLAEKIYHAVEKELATKNRASAFEKFCDKLEVPDLNAETVEEVRAQLLASFGDTADVTIKPNKKDKTLAVEVSLPDGTQFTQMISVKPVSENAAEEEPEVALKFVPFPVCLPGDKELVWMLAKTENQTPEEAGIALTKLQEDFWASKSGQKMLREGAERCFPEFIARVPSGMLREVGLKRHYKDPEPVKTLKK